MDTVATYRQLIQQLLTEHAGLVWDSRIKAEMIFDLERDRYQHRISFWALIRPRCVTIRILLWDNWGCDDRALL